MGLPPSVDVADRQQSITSKNSTFGEQLLRDSNGGSCAAVFDNDVQLLGSKNSWLANTKWLGGLLVC